jgi:class 3 adenylate cyclase
MYLENRLAAGVFTPERSELIGLLAGQMAVSIDNARLYETLEERVRERTAQLEARNLFIRRVFGRYISDDVVATVLGSEAALAFGGERRTVTVLFVDIRGFTGMTERSSAEQVVQALNVFFGCMNRVVHRHMGTIDDFTGDGMMVIFGAPIWRADDADRAVACAVEMQLAMDEVNAKTRALGLPALGIGVGLHTGEVIVGNVGSEERAKYSVVGVNVNIASRIESLTLAGQVLVSEATRAALAQPVRIDGEQRFTPKGLADAITVYEIGSVEGRYALVLPRRDAPLVPLADPAEVRVASVDGKTVGERRAPGLLVGASAHAISVETAARHDVGATVRIELPLPGGAVETVYARISAATERGFEAWLAARSEVLGRLSAS